MDTQVETEAPLASQPDTEVIAEAPNPDEVPKSEEAPESDDAPKSDEAPECDKARKVSEEVAKAAEEYAEVLSKLYSAEEAQRIAEEKREEYDGERKRQRMEKEANKKKSLDQFMVDAVEQFNKAWPQAIAEKKDAFSFDVPFGPDFRSRESSLAVHALNTVLEERGVVVAGAAGDVEKSMATLIAVIVKKDA
jgi:hypothetical protein